MHQSWPEPEDDLQAEEERTNLLRRNSETENSAWHVNVKKGEKNFNLQADMQTGSMEN